jgi:hypothetical protein
VTETIDTAVDPAFPEILAEVVDAIKELDVPEAEIKDDFDPRFADLADMMGMTATVAALTGELKYSHVVSLSFFEAVSEEDPAERRAHLLNLAALTVEWVKAIDDNAGK